MYLGNLYIFIIRKLPNIHVQGGDPLKGYFFI